jgi:mannose-6-phosphate isomerase-like protein (cupin superfamily)
MSFGENGYHLGADDGEGYDFLNSLMILKAGGEDTRGQLAIMEARTPPDYGPPPHVHAQEEEVFYVLEGNVEVMSGDQQFVAGPGSLVLTPRGTLHTFHVTDEGPGRHHHSARAVRALRRRSGLSGCGHDPSRARGT